MTEPNHIIEIKEFECPFCSAMATIQTKDIVVSGNHESGFGMDCWTCSVCGSDNDILDEFDFTELKELSEEQLSKMDDLATMNLFIFAQYLVQKKEFEKAAAIMRHIISKDKDYHQCKYLLEKVEKIINLKKLTGCSIDIQNIMYALEDHSGAINILNKKTGKVETFSDLDDKEEIPESDGYLLIEPINSKESYRKMGEFIEMVDDEEELKNSLSAAIKGPGAFQRFKDILANYSGETEYRQMWFDFYNLFLWNEAMDFLVASLQKKSGGGKPTESVEINGKVYPVVVEEKDAKISHAGIHDGKLRIVVSSRLNAGEKKRVIDSLKRRVQKSRPARFVEPVREFKDGELIDLGSKKYKIKLDFIDKKSSSGRLVGNTIHLLISANIPDDYKKKHAYEITRKILSEARLPMLRNKLKELNSTHFNAKFKDVRWKKQLSQWGSCSENKYINISYRLLFAPDDVLEYVCIHELAHLIEFNHSKRFWKLVSSAMPDYEEKEKWLKENGGGIF